jgi:MFS family permease
VIRPPVANCQLALNPRRPPPCLSRALMMIGTTLMAVTPGYATIGLAAPIILTLARLLQGFSVGGEFGSAVSFLAEMTRSFAGTNPDATASAAQPKRTRRSFRHPQAR